MKPSPRSFDLHSALLREHSKTNTHRIVRWIGTDQLRFTQLMNVILGDDALLAQRAAWVLGISVEHSPELAAPWIDAMLKRSTMRGVHPAVPRNILRALQFVPLPKRSRARAVNICADNLQSVHAPIAVKVFSMTVLLNIVRVEPDLLREAVFLIEPLSLHSSAAVRSRTKHVMDLLRI